MTEASKLVPIEVESWSQTPYLPFRLFALAITDAEICSTYPRLQMDSGRFAFRFCGPWGRLQESYLPVS